MKTRTSYVVRGMWALAFALSCGKSEPSTYQSISEKEMVIIPRGVSGITFGARLIQREPDDETYNIVFLDLFE